MNPKTIAEIEKEFDERFGKNLAFPKIGQESVKEFYRPQILALLESVVPEERKETATGFDWALHTEDAKEATKNIGWNACRAKVLAKINKIRGITQ